MNYKKQITEILNQWKADNNLVGDYVIHHRDDTEECREYNKTHYKLWGFNVDDTFEYGKYVVFMTRSEHNKHHKTGIHRSDETKAKISITNTGENNPFYGKRHSDETKVKMSQNNARYWKGKHFPDEMRAKLSAANKGKHPSNKARITSIKFLYDTYKNNGGKKKWNDFQAAIKSGDITFEMHPISVFTNGGK